MVLSESADFVNMFEAAFWASFEPETRASAARRRQVQVGISESGHLYDLSEEPGTVAEWAVDEWLAGTAFCMDGHALSDGDRDRLRAMCQVERVPSQYGVSVAYASIRAWPSHEEVFSDSTARIVERGQLSTLHIGEPVHILGQSADRRWYLIRCSTYQGWVSKGAVGVCDRAQFTLFAAAVEYLVVVARGAAVEPDPYHGAQPVPLEFGSWIPLDYPSRESWTAQYRVLVPRRDGDGRLVVGRGYVPMSATVHAGFLPFTPHSVVTSAFQLLGDRYGWGGRMSRRDCSGFVMDVYRTLGVQLPRDASYQEKALPVRPMTEATKLRHAVVGDLLPMPGHIMIYLGRNGGRDYVVHAFVGFCETPDSAPILPNQVMVTPLDIYLRRGAGTYLDAVTSIRQVV